MVTALSSRLVTKRVFASLVDLQRALDLDSFWASCVRLVKEALPHRSCSLMFDIVDFEPKRARHHVTASRDPAYIPATSLAISSPFLARHPQIPLYTYSQVASEDPGASARRLAQEPDPEWDEFVHLAFWRAGFPEAVLSIHRAATQSRISHEEMAFLEQVHPMIDAGLHRLQALEHERMKSSAFEDFLRRMPLAVMFVGFDDAILFCSEDARRLCERWNRSLPRTGYDALKLPPCMTQLLERALPGDDGSTWISHPRMDALRIRIQIDSRLPGLRERPSYLISIFDGEEDGGRERAPSGQALTALQKLTASERRVALLVARGLRNDEIAQRICRSRRTVESQVSSIFGKLDLSNRAQLARLLN